MRKKNIAFEEVSIPIESRIVASQHLGLSLAALVSKLYLP
jgi:hypothetical protein